MGENRGTNTRVSSFPGKTTEDALCGLPEVLPSDTLLDNMLLVIALLVPVLFPTPLPEVPEFISYIKYLYSNSYFRSPPKESQPKT